MKRFAALFSVFALAAMVVFHFCGAPRSTPPSAQPVFCQFSQHSQKGKSLMANTIVTKGGAAVVLAVTPGLPAGAPAGVANGSYDIYNNTNTLIAGPTPVGTASTNGDLVSASTTASTTIQIPNSSVYVAGATGYYVITSINGQAYYSYFDVAAAPPVVPAGVTATAGPNLAVTFNAGNASAQSSGTTYNLLRGTTAGGENATPVASGITALPFTYTEAAPGTFFYKLTATSGSTTSVASAEVSTTAYNAASQPSNTAGATPSTPLPGAVTGLTLALADNGTSPNPTLTWTLPTSGQAVTGINVTRGTTAGGENATPLNGNNNPLPASTSSFVDTTAAYNTDYYYQVATLDAGGATNSAEVHIKTDTAAPTSLTVTPGNNVITLAWTNAAGALATLIETSATGTGGWAALLSAAGTQVIVGAGVATYADTTAVNGARKFYRVRDLD